MVYWNNRHVTHILETFYMYNKLIVIHKCGNKRIAELRDFLLLLWWKNDAKKGKHVNV